MPWPVYSERFLHHQAAGHWEYFVPDEMRAIITSIDLINYAPAGSQVAVTVGPVFLEFVTFQASEPVIHRSMRAVAYQGERIGLDITATGVHCTVSGYLMGDNTGRTGPPPSAAAKPIRPTTPLPTPQPA